MLDTLTYHNNVGKVVHEYMHRSMNTEKSEENFFQIDGKFQKHWNKEDLLVIT